MARNDDRDRIVAASAADRPRRRTDRFGQIAVEERAIMRVRIDIRREPLM
jgi:hypothetical protein